MAVLALLIMSGCLSQDPDPADTSTPTTPVPSGGIQAHAAGGGNATAPGIRIVPGFSLHGNSALEPTIGIDGDGHIYVTASRLTDDAAVIMASLDQGASWIDIGPHLGPVAPDQPRHPITTDPYVVVDAVTGRVWTADLIHNCVELSWTDDEGASWLTNPNGCGAPGILDHQTLVAAPPRTVPTVLYPNLLYICGNEITHIDCAISPDGGITWGPQRLVDTKVSTSLCSALTGHLAADDEGRVYLPSTSCPTGAGAPMLYRTIDDGLTWTAHTVSDDPAFAMTDGDHDVAVSVDDDGNVYVNWLDRDARVRLAISRDHGDTWGPALDVTIPGVKATAYNQVAAGAAGMVAVVYIGTDAAYTDPAGGGPGLDDDAAEWYPYFGVILDAFADEPQVYSLAATDAPIALGQCGRIRCGGLVDFISMEVDPEGRPWASMVDVEAGNKAGAITLKEGPSLRNGTLTPLAW